VLGIVFGNYLPLSTLRILGFEAHLRGILDEWGDLMNAINQSPQSVSFVVLDIIYNELKISLFNNCVGYHVHT